MLRYIAKYTKSLLTALIILVLSFLPLNSVSGEGFLDIPHLDKIAHFGFYALLAFMILLESGIKRNVSGLDLLKIIVLLLVFGSLIEIGQYFLPARTASWLDLLADLGGSLIAVPAYFLFLKIRS